MEKIRKWIATGGFWSMSDQAIVSLGNFLLTVLLARFLSKVEYGTYVVIYGALVTAHSLHAALVSYPISVLGVNRAPHEMGRFSANSLIVMAILSAPISAGLILLSWIITHQVVILVFVICAMICWQVQETLRRALMSHLRHRRAIVGDAVTYGGQVVIVYWLVHHSQIVTARIGFEAIVVASVAGAILHGFALRLRLPTIESLRLVREYFTLGRYPLLSTVGYAGTLLVLPWALAFKGMAEVASYQAMMNVVQVVNPVMFSVGNLLIPAVAHELLKPAGESKARAITYRYMLEGAALLAPVFIAVLIAPKFIMSLLYGRGSGYLEHDALLRFLVIGACALFFSHVLQSYLLGKKRVTIVARAQLIASAAVVLCACVLIPTMGITGAVISFLVMGGVRSWVLLGALRNDSKNFATVDSYTVSVEKA